MQLPASNNPFIAVTLNGYISTLVLFIWLLLSFTTATAQSEPQDQSQDQRQTVVFAVAPWDTEQKLNRHYQPLMRYIEQQLSITSVFTVTRDYAELVQHLQTGQIQIGFLPAVSYVKAKEIIPGLTLLAGNTDQNPANGLYRNHYKGVIITLKKSSLNSLESLKNKRFGFTDPDSSSGYKYPLQLLNDNGIEPYQFFSQVFMLKKHHKVTQALINGAIDGGATWDTHLGEMNKKHGNIFTVVAQTQPIPFDAVVASPAVARSTANQIKQLLLQITPQSELIKLVQQSGLTTFGWEKTSDSNYDPVRRILDTQASDNHHKQLVFGIPLSKSAAKEHKMWAPLLRHIGDKTGTTVTLQIVGHYNELATRMKNGQFDIGVFPPFAYVKATTQMPQLGYVATLLKTYADNHISAHYNGVLVSLKKSNIRTLADLRRKRFAFTSKSSTSGYLYPRAFLKQQHISPSSYFSQVFMLQKHPKIIKALLSGAIDAGVTTDDELFKAQRRYGDIFTTITKTEDIPFDALAIAPHVSRQLREKIRHTILSIEKHPLLLQQLKTSHWKYSGFSAKGDAFYNGVRHVRDTLKGVALSDNKTKSAKP